MNVPAFSEAWEKWQQHRREIRKPITPTAAVSLLKKLAGWGVDRAVAAIEHSIASGWQGIFEKNGERTHDNHNSDRVTGTPGKYADAGTTIG